MNQSYVKIAHDLVVEAFRDRSPEAEQRALTALKIAVEARRFAHTIERPSEYPGYVAAQATRFAAYAAEQQG